MMEAGCPQKYLNNYAMQKIILLAFSFFCVLCSKAQVTALRAVDGMRNALVVDSGMSVNDGKALLFTRSVTSKELPVASMTRGVTASKELQLKTTFKINIPTQGGYYLQAGVSPVFTKNKQLQPIVVYVNGVEQGLLDCHTSGWEITGVKGKPQVALNKGDNTVEFVTEGPFYPNVGFVQVSKSSQEQVVFANRVKANQAEYKSPWQTSPKGVILDSTSMVTAWKDVPVVYTYQNKFNVAAAGKVTIHTTPIEGEDYYAVDPYMYLFNVDNPNAYSWSNDNSTGLHPKIEVNLPAGDYYLVICSKINDYAHSAIPFEGSVNVYYNGEILTEGTVVSGFMIDAPTKYVGVLNYFTSKCREWAKLYLLDGNKMLFCSEMNTYYPPADYGWINGARRKIQTYKTYPNFRVLVTATIPMAGLYGSCDVYCGLIDAPSKYLTKFPNLKSGDAILLGEDNASYNSAAWAGGIIKKNIWIGNTSYGLPYGWASWDNYFANNPLRYIGAKSYSRTGTGELAVVMYSKDNTMSGVSHFAVTNHANDRMHGFAYDSKIGSWGRITHETNSLNGTEYGQPYVMYYEDESATTASAISEKRVYTLRNSIADGLTVEKNVPLDTEEEAAIQQAVLRKETKMLTFEQLFQQWAEAVDAGNPLQENLFSLLDNEQGQALIDFGKQHLPEATVYMGNLLFGDKLDGGMSADKELLSILYCKMALDKYASLLEDIKANWEKNPYTEDGSHIYPSCEYFTKQYIKKVLRRESLVSLALSTKEEKDTTINNNKHLFQVTENPVRENGTDVILHVPSGKKFSLKLVDATTGVQTSLATDVTSMGNSSVFHVNASAISSGLTVCVLEIDGKTYSRKIVKK